MFLTDSFAYCLIQLAKWSSLKALVDNERRRNYTKRISDTTKMYKIFKQQMYKNVEL